MLVGKIHESGVVGDVEIFAYWFIFEAVGDSDGVGGVDSDELLMIGLGVGAVGVVEEECELFDWPEYEMDVAACDFYDSGVCDGDEK